MKKTYGVYSIFEKTLFSSVAKTTAFLSIFLFCFLGVMSDASAQDFINADNPTVALPTVDVDFLKPYTFKQDREDVLSLLKLEVQAIVNDPGYRTGVYEADLNSRKFYIESIAKQLSNDADADLQKVSIKAYRDLSLFATNYAVPVDIEGIATYYSDLISQ